MSKSAQNPPSNTENHAAGSPFESARKSGAPKWLVGLAKLGYGARGLVYVIIGGLAALQAAGQGGDSSDSKGAIDEILSNPGGVFLLWILVVGFVGHSAWRLCQALLDADNRGMGLKAVAIRSGLFVSAIVHLSLAYYAASAATRLVASTADSSSSSESAVARMLTWPGGDFLVGAIGLAIIGAGVGHGIKAVREKYKERFAVDSATMSKLNGICKVGLFARGITFAIIGGMFLAAAITQESDRAGGLKEVLNEVSQQAFGPYLLGTLALGLMAFGLYSMIEMLYRKIQKPRFIG